MSLPHLSIFQESSRPCHLRSLFRHSRSPHCHPRENAQLSGENHEIRNQWHFHLKAIISGPFSLIPAPSIVIPAPSIVIPAKAGTQGPMQHIAGVMAFPLAKILSVALDPRSGAGVTRVEIEYSLQNQVLRAAFSLETLTHYVPRKIFLIFPRTAVRFRGDDKEWGRGTTSFWEFYKCLKVTNSPRCISKTRLKWRAL